MVFRWAQRLESFTGSQAYLKAGFDLRSGGGWTAYSNELATAWKASRPGFDESFRGLSRLVSSPASTAQSRGSSAQSGIVIQAPEEV